MHSEDNIKYPSSYYTGKKSTERGLYLNYKSRYYFENLSAGHKSIYKSIDALMSAIYHRYVFLRNNIDEIGIGINKFKPKYTVYNYNMGNSLLGEICNGYSFTGKSSYIYKVCKDEKFRVEKSLYKASKNYLASESPKYIIWPGKDAKYIQPVFFEEHPDPLPNSSVSGYPISIEFNSYYFDNKDVEINSFRIYNENNAELKNTLLMNYLNDPNNKHNRFQYTLFPLERLKGNHKYKIKIEYLVDGYEKYIEWSFTTRGIDYPYYEIKDKKSTIKVNSGKSYILYMVPQHNNDIFKSWKLTKKEKSKSIIKYIDGNTLLINLRGKIGQKYTVKLSNARKITIYIANEDSAKIDKKR